MQNILVVVDMQNDFINGSLGTPEAKHIVKNVVDKINNFSGNIIITHDTHYAETYDSTSEGKHLPVKHCIQFEDGWNINDHILAAANESKKRGNKVYHVYKNTFGSTQLIGFVPCYEDSFNKSNITVEFVGVCTDICVISNALLIKAYYPDINIVVDASCCAGTTPDMHNKALDVMKSCHIDICNWS